MLTNIDFNRIVSSMIPGSIFRVAVNSTREFNSQRMILYRVISNFKKTKYLNISIRKIEIGSKMFLEFERKEDTGFSILERDPKTGEFVERVITGDKLTPEELEFNSWVERTKEEKETEE